MARDPVCGLDIHKERLCSDYKGKHFCFCGESCKERFDRDPEKYMKK